MDVEAPRRGTYAKTVQRRKQIMDAAFQVFSRAGFHNASLADIAGAAGLSIAGVNHHFATKTLLLEAVFDQRDTEAESYFRGGRGLDLLRGLVDLAERDQSDPEATRFYAIMAAEATAEDHPANTYFSRRYALVLSYVEGAFREAQAEGLLRAEVEPDEAARSYIALSDGLQLQRLYQPSAFSQAAITRKMLNSLLVEPL